MRQLTTGLTNICNDVEVLPNVCVPDIVKAKIQSSTSRENLDDSLFLCDLGDVMLKHKTWMDTFPRIAAHYAVRCNPDKMLLKWLIAMGVGFNCANKSELKLVLDLGAATDKIIFGNPCKQASHIRFAAQNNIKQISFDSMTELKKIKKNYPEAELLLCIAVDDSEASDDMNMKFGASMKDAEGLISSAVELGLNVVGISFNVENDEMEYMQAFKRARLLFNYAKSIGVNLSVLDVGGDFPATDKKERSFKQIAKIINEEIEKHFASNEFSELRIIGEPGSFYVETAFTVCTSIIAKKEVGSMKDDHLKKAEADNDGVGFMYYINDGVYGCFNILFGDQNEFTPTPLKKFGVSSQQQQQYPSNIWGPTCDGLDKVCELAYLPEMEIGDWIMWNDIGAYSMACGSKFNGFRTSCVHYYISENNWREVQSSVTVDEEQSAIFFKDASVSNNENGLTGTDLKSSKVEMKLKSELFTCDKSANFGKGDVCSI